MSTQTEIPDTQPSNHGLLASKIQNIQFEHFTVTFPTPKIVQVTLTRQSKLNSITKSTSAQLAQIWELFDADPSLIVGIITGSGRAFCTGADLGEWNAMVEAGIINSMEAPGLGGLCRREGKKPVIAAVNGICMGGGFEMVANCDLIVAAKGAIFALPETKRGIVPVAGCLPRLTRTLGLQRTMDLVLTGRSVPAQVLYEWGLVNRICDNAIDSAIDLANAICENSPDSTIVGRRGVRMAWEGGSVEEATDELERAWYPKLMQGANFAEGIRAFGEKRSPRWVGSKL